MKKRTGKEKMVHNYTTTFKETYTDPHDFKPCEVGLGDAIKIIHSLIAGTIDYDTAMKAHGHNMRRKCWG